MRPHAASTSLSSFSSPPRSLPNVWYALTGPRSGCVTELQVTELQATAHKSQRYRVQGCSASRKSQGYRVQGYRLQG